MSSNTNSIAWDLGHAPQQSITEVLQNPRGPSIELPDFDLSAATALALSSPNPTTNLPDPLNINHFEDYLRRYAPLYEQFNQEKERIDATVTATTPTLSASKQSSTASETSIISVPDLYFDPSFTVSKNHQLASLQPAHSHTPSPPLPPDQVSSLRTTLTSYKISLEHQLRTRLATQSTSITTALSQVRTLRAQLIDTATDLHRTTTLSKQLVPAVTDALQSARALAALQTNIRALRQALASVQQVLHVPDDVAILLQTGEYEAAIHAVQAAKDALAHPHLTSVVALATARGRLAQAVEAIDTALRDEFRNALRAGKSQEATLREVVSLVAVMGRLPLLRGFFLKEIKNDLAKKLKTVDALHAACREVKATADRALMLITIIHSNGEDAEGLDYGDVKAHLREIHDDLEEMLASSVDRFLGSFAVSNATGPGAAFVVITDRGSLSEQTCFDEFKAALKFGEEVRNLEEAAKELEKLFSSDKKGSALRAKISERHIAFLSAFHKAHVETITQTIRADKWQEIHVPKGALRLLAAVIDNGTENGNDDHEGQGGHAAQHNVNSITRPLQSDLTEGSVVIGEDAFKTVDSGVRYLRSICAYTLLAEESPNLAPEIARRATELSRLFNSLIGKAVLGAAALQWSGLRSITARHLSLASRTVAMAAALADRINTPLARALSSSQVGVVLPLIQRSEKDLRDHHAQLLAKILAIMMDRLEAHETVLRSLPWDKDQEMKRFDIPSSYIATLVKEATVLHRILWSILPTGEVCDIFQRVCAAYGTHLTEAYGSLDGGKRWIRVRVAEDVVCLHDRLMVLDVFNTNPEAFKPIHKLYVRFAKEEKEAEATAKAQAKSKAGRGFMLRHSERPEAQSESHSNGSATADHKAKAVDGSPLGSGEMKPSTAPDTVAPSADDTAHRETGTVGADMSNGNAATEQTADGLETRNLIDVSKREGVPELKQAKSSAEGNPGAENLGLSQNVSSNSMAEGEVSESVTESVAVSETRKSDRLHEEAAEDRQVEQGLNEILGINTENGHEEENGFGMPRDGQTLVSEDGRMLEDDVPTDLDRTEEVPEGDLLGLGNDAPNS